MSGCVFRVSGGSRWQALTSSAGGFRGHPDYEAAPRTTHEASRRTTRPTRPASPDESAAPPVPLWNPILGSWWDPILIDIAKKLPF